MRIPLVGIEIKRAHNEKLLFLYRYLEIKLEFNVGTFVVSLGQL